MTQERFLLVPPGFTRDTVMRDMAHNSYRTPLIFSTAYAHPVVKATTASQFLPDSPDLFDGRPSSLAPEAVLRKGFRESPKKGLFLGRYRRAYLGILVFQPPVEPSARLRSAAPSLRLAEDCSAYTREHTSYQ